MSLPCYNTIALNRHLAKLDEEMAYEEERQDIAVEIAERTYSTLTGPETESSLDLMGDIAGYLDYDFADLHRFYVAVLQSDIGGMYAAILQLKPLLHKAINAHAESESEREMERQEHLTRRAV
ncbi:MAG: hypothetical protein GX776_06015 [Oxalobacter sp.]|nr:hypothetical protein [Oxalobacter sp.]